jgi:hypothetical protein
MQPQSNISKNPDASGLMRTVYAARYLNVSASLLEKFRVSGDGPPFMKIGRIVCYREADLDIWLTARVRRSTSAGA